MSLSEYPGAGLLLKGIFSAERLIWGESVACEFWFVSLTQVTGLAGWPLS